MSSTEQEKVPFLFVGSAGEHIEAPDRNFVSRRNKFSRLHWPFLGLQLLLLCLNIVFLIITTSSLDDGHLSSNEFARTFSPADPALNYITVEELSYDHHSSLYTGEPRPELDQAWSHLLRSTLLRLSEEEMKRMNKTSLALRDGSGYVGYLEAHHMLHCLKRIYQARHPSHYPEQERDGAFDDAHLYHCLDVLREGVMCNADVTINTLIWETSTKVQGTRPGPRKCVDWSRLQAWADERTLTAKDRETFLAEQAVPYGDMGSMGPESPMR